MSSANIDWNGFINDFMKEIHIIVILNLTFTYINLMRIGFFSSERIHLRHFSGTIQIYSSLHGATGGQYSN